MPIPAGDDFPTTITDLADVKTFLQITDTSFDAVLQGYIDAASAWVNFVSGQILPQQFTNEVHSGGTKQIQLFNSPIISIGSVIEYVGQNAYPLIDSERGGINTPYSYSLDNPGQGLITRIWNTFPGVFQGGTNSVVITYTAGYATIPADIVLAVKTDIQGLFQQQQYGSGASPYGTGIGSESADAWTVPPMNAFPRLASLLTSSRRVQAVA